MMLKSLLQERLHRAFCGRLGSEGLLDVSDQVREDTYNVLDTIGKIASEDLEESLARDPALSRLNFEPRKQAA